MGPLWSMLPYVPVRTMTVVLGRADEAAGTTSVTAARAARARQARRLRWRCMRPLLGEGIRWGAAWIGADPRSDAAATPAVSRWRHSSKQRAGQRGHHGGDEHDHQER